jgi:hypothetical protein
MKKTSFSIKIIYWITQITFWLFNAVGIFAVGLAFALIFKMIGPTQLNVGIPVSVDILEKGSLALDGSIIQTQFVEMMGKIHFVDTPLFLGQVYGIFMLIMLGMFYFMFFTFRKFIINVYRGRFFDLGNTKLLKRIAYSFAIVWAFTAFYAYFQYFYIVKNLSYHSVEISANIETYPVVLLVGLFIWVLSHIFQKGVELQEENNLTV